MKIRILGAGPAGLSFAAMMKRHDASHDIQVLERSPRGATWGFGVVFSDRALGFLLADDPELHALLTPHMETWDNLSIVHNGTRVPIAGNGFSAISRLQLLQQLQAHAEGLGVGLHFDVAADSLDAIDPHGDADLIVVASGASSGLRDANAAAFGTKVDWRPNRFIWFGTSQVFDSLTLTFRETEYGVFCAHHYRYSPQMSTFLVEVTQATFERAGLEGHSEAQTRELCERVFADDLGGHPIVSNHSHWRQFPVVWNERWHAGKTVLLGDALRTAHFSIGSGTRLAMEDAIALFKALRDAGLSRSPSPAAMSVALAEFQARRTVPVHKICNAANASLRWYERMDEWVPALRPVELAYSYMTRTGRVSHAEVRQHEPALAAAYEALHPEINPS